MFASEGGRIRGWNPNVPPPPLDDAFVVATGRNGGDLQGPRHRVGQGRQLPLRDRLPQRPRRCLRRPVRPGQHGRVPSRTRASPPDTRRSGSRTSAGASSSPTPSRTPIAEDEIGGAGLGFVDQYDRTATGSLASRPHGSLDAPWGIAMAPGQLRPLQRRPAGGQLRQRPDQRLPRDRQRLGARRRAQDDQGKPIRSTACGRSRSVTAARQVRGTRSTSRPARTTRATASSGPSPQTANSETRRTAQSGHARSAGRPPDRGLPAASSSRMAGLCFAR